VGNLISISNSAEFINSEIIISGSNNHVSIGPGAVLSGVRMQISSNGNVVEIASACRVTAQVIMKLTDNNRLNIGHGTTVGGCNFICGEGRSIVIGKDCMLAWNLEIRTTDSHAIVDAASGARINPAKDVIVDDHVWVGAHATLLKGTHIRRNSVVSMRSVVTHAFGEEGVVLGGSPARIIRSGVTWERPLLG